ncbi:hypothetical protein ACI2LF_05965 [Kribbella sp. NPDC020789]
MKTTRSSIRPRSAGAVLIALTAAALSVFTAAPASAAVRSSETGARGLENDCKAWALTDRKDGSTSTYGAGGLRCEHDNYTSIELEIKLYKDGKLKAVQRATCDGPPIKTCSVNTSAVAGSRGTWKTVTTGWAVPNGENKYTASHTKTW